MLIREWFIVPPTFLGLPVRDRDAMRCDVLAATDPLWPLSTPFVDTVRRRNWEVEDSRNTEGLG